MKTFLANLQHAAHGTQCTAIGDDSFSPPELQVVVETIRDMTEAFRDIASSEDAEYSSGIARAILARVQS